MPNDLQLPPPGFERLSADEKLDYVEALWDLVREAPEGIPVPEWHRRIIEERKKAPEPGLSWDEVRRRVEERIRNGQ